MGLILPGPQPPRGGLTLYVPRGAERRIIGECFLCGAQFAEGDDPIAHARKCVSQAGHDVRMEREEKVDRMEIFLDPNAWNPDVEQHLRKVGQRMLKEGRLEMRPNERIHNE